MQKQALSLPKLANGFTLLEVLVAMVVLSIGLLGLAGLQATSLSANNTAYQRTQATVLAFDMLDRIRANVDGLRSDLYNSLTAGTADDPNCFGNSGGCTPTQIVAYDNYDWGQKLASALPAGKGKVAGSGADSTFTITVMWDEARTGATGTECSGDLTVDLYCLTISSQL